MREVCLFCVSKHLSQAIVLTLESVQGYSEHIWLAIGHLGEAADECVAKYPEFAAEIRKVRMALMGQEGVFHTKDLMELLREARKIAAKHNSISEEERIMKIIYPWRQTQ